MKLQQDLETQLVQEPSFGGSNLPRTIGMAVKLRRFVEPELDESTRRLPYDDRVVAWLAPNLLREMIHFHAGRGKGLVELFAEPAIAHLDAEFFALLANRICSTYPQAIPSVNRFLRKRLK